MQLLGWLAVIWVSSAMPQAPPAPQTTSSAADRVTLKDGAVLLGNVINPSDRGKLVMVVRRAWAKRHHPEKTQAWEAAEAPWFARALAERRTRLAAWREERAAGLNVQGDRARSDALLKLLDAELDRLARLEAEPKLPPLLMIGIDRRDITKVERQPPANLSLLRMGWRARFEDVEELDRGELARALEARNFDVRANESPVAIDDLLPIPIESDADWRLKRAATEVKTDRSVWFVRHGDALIADDGGGDALGPGALAGLGNLNSLLRELTGAPAPPDPLLMKLPQLAEKGQIGALVTTLEIAADLSGVKVTSELWVNIGPGTNAWRSAGTRSARVRTDDLAVNAAANLAANPQVDGIFRAVEGLGLGELSPEIKQRALAIGAATQQALAQVRELASADLDRLAITFGNDP